jgi:6-phosphogluconolactonase
MENKEIIVFPGVAEIAEYLVELMVKIIIKAGENRTISVALPGGSTPQRIFKHMAEYHKSNCIWQHINFFFGDERCVPPDHEESNFRMVHHSLFEIPGISGNQIFRIQGENDPAEEARRYGKIVAEKTRMDGNWPSFDLIMLGLGEDGHTASIFPGDDLPIHSDDFYVAVSHPQTFQKRITLTLQMINHTDKVVFIATGKNKELILREILQNRSGTDYPASKVTPLNGSLTWLLDAPVSGLTDVTE